MPEINLSTKGFNDVIDITDKVAKIVKDSDIKNGVAVLFVVGATAAI
ncbi:MAG: secondary thiamine-phosphate synthase enzyme, partial [Parcubacteria group bacterium CG_4_9_14_0_2_um_filter_35_11]